MNGKDFEKQLSKELSNISVTLVSVSDFKSFINITVKASSRYGIVYESEIKSIVRNCMNDCDFSPYWSISVNIIR